MIPRTEVFEDGVLVKTVALENADVVTRDGAGTETSRRPAAPDEVRRPPVALTTEQQLAALVAFATRTVTDITGSNPKPWKQPTGAHDAYPPGAVVIGPNGHKWRNDLAGFNVWEMSEPAAYWTDMDAVAPAGPQPWKQPTGAQDAYKMDSKVTHQGKTWTSTADSNVWEPGVYGWK